MENESIREKSFFRRILTLIINFLIVSIILFCILVGYGVGINNRFYKILVVKSGSMSPVFNTGDLIVITRIDPKKAKAGDIVTFKTRDGLLLTHRIVEIKTNGEIVTKGDANNSVDTWSDGWKLIKVETKYLFKIPKLGFFINWCQGIFHQKSKVNTGAFYSDTKQVTGNVIQAK